MCARLIDLLREMTAELPDNSGTFHVFIAIECTDKCLYKNLIHSSYYVIGTVSPPIDMPVMSTACWDRIFPEITYDCVIASSCQNPYFHHRTPTQTNQWLQNKMIAGIRRSRFAWDDGKKGSLWNPVLVTAVFGLALGGDCALLPSRTLPFLRQFPMKTCLQVLRCHQVYWQQNSSFACFFIYLLFFIWTACIVSPQMLSCFFGLT